MAHKPQLGRESIKLKSTDGPHSCFGWNGAHSLEWEWSVSSGDECDNITIVNSQHVTGLIFVCESPRNIIIKMSSSLQAHHLRQIDIILRPSYLALEMSCPVLLSASQESRGSDCKNGSFQTDICTNSNAAAPRRPKLNSLPSELQLEIFRHLDPTSAICLSITCRTLNSLYEKERLRRRPPYLSLYHPPQWNRPGRRSELGVLLSKWMEPRIWDDYIGRFTTQAQMEGREQSRRVARRRMEDSLLIKRNK
jgi:hypothetical protein